MKIWNLLLQSVLLAMLLMALNSRTAADTIYLDSGGILEGTILREDDDEVVIKCKYGEVSINRNQIDRIERGDNKEIYKAKLKELKEDDVSGHYELGAWAASVGLTEESTKQYEYVVKLDPDHEGARQALGYMKLDDRWVTQEEYYTAKGYVQYQNQWMSRDEADKLAAGYVRWRGDWVKKEDLKRIQEEERKLREAQRKAKKTKKEPTRVEHYAVLISGTGNAYGLLWKWSDMYYKMLKETYGYTDEAIFRLCREGKAKDPSADGKCSPANVRKVFEHLAKIMQEDDHLFVYIAAHGIVDPRKGMDFVNNLLDGNLYGEHYKEMLGWLPTKQITWLSCSCYGGAVIPKISAPGRVICTAVNARQSHNSGIKWDENMVAGLIERMSVKATYNFMLESTGRGEIEQEKTKEKKPGTPPQGPGGAQGKGVEYSLIDDNGDGQGHFGMKKVVEGDGELAAKRFLGNNGKMLSHKEEWIEALKKLNEGLALD